MYYYIIITFSKYNKLWIYSMSSTACCISFISFSLFSSIFSFSLTGTLSVSWTLLSASFTSSCSCRWGLSSYLWRRYLRKKLFSFNKLLSYEMTVVVTLLCYSFEVLGKQLNHKYFSKWKLQGHQENRSRTISFLIH